MNKKTESMESNQLSKWIHGIAYELAFWNNVYRWGHTFRGMMGWSHYGRAIELESFDANGYLFSLQSPVVLDVGCGMSYATGNYLYHEGQLHAIDIHYVDALAYYFNDILRKYNRDLPRVEFGMVEYLSSFFLEESADLIVIQNALDHSSNPIKGIVEALHVLKTNGILYLNHHPNEAVTEQYKGFHQFNINVEDGRLVIWNEEQRVFVDERIAPYAQIETRVHDNGHIVAIIRKTHHVPHEQCDCLQDRKMLCQSLLQSSRMVLRTGSGMRLAYWKYNVIQFFAQLLPWEVKMGLKKLIKQTPNMP